ncbi:unnamed protein product [Pedinophyceae sp. YPF-701]|nr:unnamed protein product [Pedinophyceae sp. YPF-701]
MSVVRVWAHTSRTDVPLQLSPGTYSREALEGLDRVLFEASRAGLRVILSLADNWKAPGGVEEYLDWSRSVPKRDTTLPEDDEGNVDLKKLDGATRVMPSRTKLARRHALFFADAECRDNFRGHIAAILGRRNSLTGARYADEVMAVSLLNEPRCETWAEPRCNRWVHDWIAEMAAAVHDVAPGVLVSVGGEGFFGPWDDQELQDANPGTWAAQTGQNFVANAQETGVDFLEMHLWPSNWEAPMPQSFAADWIDAHVGAARELQLPIVLTEFGGHKDGGARANEAREETARVFSRVYDLVEEHMAGGDGAPGVLAGTLFWRFETEALQDREVGPYDTTAEHPAFAVAVEHAARVRGVRGRLREGEPSGERACWVPEAWVREGA